MLRKAPDNQRERAGHSALRRLWHRPPAVGIGNGRNRAGTRKRSALVSGAGKSLWIDGEAAQCVCLV